MALGFIVCCTSAFATDHVRAEHQFSAVVTPTTNLEQGYGLMGSLMGRRGDNFPMMWDSSGCLAKNAKGQLWRRFLGSYLYNEGKDRFDYQSGVFGGQIGVDILRFQSKKGIYHHISPFLGFSLDHLKYFDRQRSVAGQTPDDQLTGKARNALIAFGLDYSASFYNGAYVDVLGQMAYLHNEYMQADKSYRLQRGWNAGLSIETGHAFQLGHPKSISSRWMLAPELQLMYQYQQLHGFSPEIGVNVGKSAHHGLRARAGLRLTRYMPNKKYTHVLYGVVNIYQDLLKRGHVGINQSMMTEKFVGTIGEMGGGFDLAVKKQLRLNLDLRFQHGFVRQKHLGFVGNFNIKYLW